MTREVMASNSFGIRKAEETVPPPGEQVLVHAVWAMEAYTPLHIRQFVDRLEELGFGETSALRGEGLRSEIEQIRRSPRGGSWLNLDHVFPPGSNRLPFSGIERPLPPGVVVARPALHMYTSGIAVLVVQFVLDDDTAEAYDRLSRRIDFQTRVFPNGRGISINSPDQVKQQQLDQLRGTLRRLATGWVTRNVPGAFANNRSAAPIPSAELVTTEQLLPFARTSSPHDYSHSTDLSYDWDYWRTEDFGSWRLLLRDEQQVVTIAGRRSDVTPEKGYAMYGGDERWGLTYIANKHVDKLLAHWAVACLTREYAARLAVIRDRGLQGGTGAFAAARRLKAIRSELVQDAGEARIVANEVRRYTASKRRFEWNTADWKSNDEVRPGEDLSLLDVLRENMREEARSLDEAERIIRDALTVDSSVVGALSNLRVQSYLLFTTLIAILIAAASLWVAVHYATKSTEHKPAHSRIGALLLGSLYPV